MYKKMEEKILEKVNKTQTKLNETEGATMIDYASEWLKFANELQGDLSK